MKFIDEKLHRSLSIIISLIGIFLQYYYYNSIYVYNNISIFLLIILMISLNNLLYMMLYPNKINNNLFLLLFTSFSFNILYSYYSRNFNYIPPLDAIYHRKISEAIIINGKLNMYAYNTQMENDYSSYPGFHLILGITSLVTGCNSIYVTKFIPIIYTVMPFIMYFISKNIFISNRISLISAFIVTFPPKWYSFPSYSRFVFIFVLFLLYSIVQYQIKKKNEYLFLILIFSFCISITHHITNYIMIGLFTFILVSNKILRLVENKIQIFIPNFNVEYVKTDIFMILIIVNIIYPIYSAFIATNFHLNLLLKFLSPYYIPESFSISIMGSYYAFEKYFIFAILILVGCIGILGFLKYIFKERSNILLVSIIIFFGLMTIVAIPLMYVNTIIMDYVQYRLVFIIFIFISPFVGYAINEFMSIPNKKYLNYIKTIIIVLVFLGFSYSTVKLVPQSYYNFSQEESSGYLWDVRGYSNSLHRTLLWMSEQYQLRDDNPIAIGDTPIKSIGNGMYDLNVKYYWDVYERPLNESEVNTLIRRIKADYVFFDALLLDYKQQPSFAVFVDSIPLSQVDYLMNCDWLNKVYDNGVFMVFHVIQR